MKSVVNYLRDFMKEEDGLETVEYAIAGALIAVVVAAAFATLGGDVCQKINQMAGIVTGNPQAASSGYSC